MVALTPTTSLARTDSTAGERMLEPFGLVKGNCTISSSVSIAASARLRSSLALSKLTFRLSTSVRASLRSPWAISRMQSWLSMVSRARRRSSFALSKRSFRLAIRSTYKKRATAHTIIATAAATVINNHGLALITSQLSLSSFTSSIQLFLMLFRPGATSPMKLKPSGWNLPLARTRLLDRDALLCLIVSLTPHTSHLELATPNTRPPRPAGDETEKTSYSVRRRRVANGYQRRLRSSEAVRASKLIRWKFISVRASLPCTNIPRCQGVCFRIEASTEHLSSDSAR